MFSEFFEQSNILEMIHEETEEESGLHKVVFRVKDRKRWSSLLKNILLNSYDEDEFGVSIRKEYFINEETEQPTFCWAALFWGDVADAAATLGSLFAKKAGPPPKPKAVTQEVASAAGVFSIIKDRHVSRDSQGNRVEKTTVALPFRTSSARNKKLDKTKKMNQKGRGAYVESINGDEGNPW